NPGPGEDQTVAGADGTSLARRYQIERLALRSKRPRRPAGQSPAEIVGEHRTCTDGVDARLGQVAARESDGVTGREDLVGPNETHPNSHPEKATLVERQSALG